ncbi:hypothetical protein ACOCEA_09890 [Maribacter sp. CXY002]|uniref:hypothetical protein n=1 Tax=Maribacter luteocoastalis TaxID=3407671 RepID=UPI003B685A8B
MTAFKYFAFLLLFSFYSVSSQVLNVEESASSNFDLNIVSNQFYRASNIYDLTNIENRITYMMPKEANSNSILSLEYLDTDSVSDKLNMKYPFKRRKHPMEKTGRILTYIGVPLAIIGGIMVAGADELYYECVNGNCSGDARGGFGVVMLGAGAGLAGTGTVLWIIGSKK